MIQYKALLGHNKIKDFFNRIITGERNDLSSSYLFIGPEGVGKATFTFEFLKAYFCVSNKIKPCEECRNCKRITHFNFPDIRPVLPEKIEQKYLELIRENDVTLQNPRSTLFSRNLTIKISQIRSLEQEIYIPPYEGKKKFYIFLDADLMKKEAQNALLKTLEEPPRDIVFILISSRPYLLYPTIRSRTQTFVFSPLDFDEFSKYKFPYPVDIKYLYRLSNGSIGKALYFIEKDFIELKKKVLQCVVSGKSVLSLWKGRVYSEEISMIFQILQTLYRDLILVKLGAKKEVINEDILPVYERYANKINLWNIERKYFELKELEDALTKYVDPNLLLLTLPKFSL